MYAALWRSLRGSTAWKVVQISALALIIISVCVEWVFPWITATFIPTDSTVGP